MGIASQEVRQRAIEAYRSGKGTQHQIAGRFGIALRTFTRWWSPFRHHGQLAPKPRGHNPPALDEREMQMLDRLLQAQPDLTLSEMREALGKNRSVVDRFHPTGDIWHAFPHFFETRDSARKSNRYERIVWTEQPLAVRWQR